MLFHNFHPRQNLARKAPSSLRHGLRLALCGLLGARALAAQPTVALLGPAEATSQSLRTAAALEQQFRALDCQIVRQPLGGTSPAQPAADLPAADLPEADLLAVLDPAQLGRAGLAVVTRYQAAGRDIVLLGNLPPGLVGQPPLLHPTPRSRQLAELARPAQTIAWDAPTTGGWSVDLPASGTPQPFSVERAAGGGALLHYASALQPIHALYISPELKLAQPFAVTLLEARGQGPIGHLFVEYETTSGARWIAHLPLSADWQRYALVPEDFRPLTPPGLGEPQPTFDPATVRRFKIGVAQHQAAGVAEPQTIEIREPALAPLPAGLATEAPAGTFPLEFTAASAFLPLPGGDVACGQRPRALGLEGPSLGRWVPWVTRPAREGGQPPVVCASWIDRRTTTGLPVWSAIGLDPARYDAALLRRCLQPIVQLNREGLLVLRGGMRQFHYEPGQPLTYGALLHQRGATTRTLTLRATWQGLEPATPSVERVTTFTLPAGQDVAFEEQFPPTELAGDCRFSLTLSTPAGLALDHIEHRFSISRPEPAPPAERVTVSDGQFLRGTRPWVPQGLHYWLPYVANQPDPRLWHDWLDPQIYDPDQAERDLSTMHELGLEAVVVPYRREREAASLRDFLFRCQRHQIKAMLFLLGAHPLELDLPQIERMIDAAALDRQGSVFAFDLAWEPHLGPRAERAALDTAWTQWVLEQYGDVATAEKLWGWAAEQVPAASGAAANGANTGGAGTLLAGPSDRQITTDGPWRIMVAAYRRFVDDHVSQRYGRVARLLRRRCPGVLLGARTGYGGTASPSIDDKFPFDLTAGADHLDYISPEAYGLAGDWSGFQPGLPIVAMARLAGRGKPVVWMEYGYNALPGDAAGLARQREYIVNLARLVRESHANGSFAWWWPGGFRFGEVSDYGLVDPFGAPRPALRALATEVQRMRHPQPAPPASVTLPVDRDLHPRGLSSIIQRSQKTFIDSTSAGQQVAFVSPAAGTSTADVPLVGVGNVAEGQGGPLKYVNAEFTTLAGQAEGEAWQPLELDHPLPAGLRRLRVGCLNTGASAWSAEGPGQVEVVLHIAGAAAARGKLPAAVEPGREATLELPLPAMGDAATGPWRLRCGSPRTGPFGQCLRLESAAPRPK